MLSEPSAVRRRGPVKALRTAVAGQRAVAASGTRRPTREERVALVRLKIFDAAAAVVGEFGYADTTISRIVERADIAQGTFYLYFASRQALFDQLLPHFGQQLIAYVRGEVSGATSFLEVEERGFVATIDFLREHRGFYRVLNEAEMAAPIAHRKHMKVLTEHYVSSMKRDVAQGRITPLRKAELEVMAHVFEGARTYLYMRYLKDAPPGKKLPEWVVRTYMTLVRSGLQA